MKEVLKDIAWTLTGFLSGLFFGYTGSISLAMWVAFSIFVEATQQLFAESSLYKDIEKKINFNFLDPKERIDEKFFETFVRYIGYVFGHYIKYGRFILI